jgi:hypothetical protein
MLRPGCRGVSIVRRCFWGEGAGKTAFVIIGETGCMLSNYEKHACVARLLIIISLLYVY